MSGSPRIRFLPSLVVAAAFALSGGATPAEAATDAAGRYANSARLANNLPTLAFNAATIDDGGAAAEELAETRAAIEADLAAAASDDETHAEVAKRWQIVSKSLDTISAQKDVALAARAAHGEIASHAASLGLLLDQASLAVLDSAKDAKDASEPTGQARSLGMMQTVLQRIGPRCAEILAADLQVEIAADMIPRDLDFLASVLAGLRDGNAELGLVKIADAEAHAALVKATGSLAALDAAAKTVVAAAPAFVAIGSAREALGFEMAELDFWLQAAAREAAR